MGTRPRIRILPKSLIEMFSTTTLKRFWNRVEKTDSCWLWTAAKNDKGYGQIRTGEIGIVYAHRMSFYLANGHWPEHQALHTCDVPACVNPEHLFNGTQADNLRDMAKKQRAGNRKFTDEQVKEIRALISTRTVTQKDIARSLGVSESLIHQMKYRITYKEVEKQ